MHTRTGFQTFAVVIAVVIIAAGALLVYNNSQKKDTDTMMESDSMMMENDHMDTMEDTMESSESMMEGDAMMEETSMMEKEDAMMESSESMMMEKDTLSFSGTVLAGSATKLYDYTEADYTKAVASDKLVVLYFYANWCPTCKEEVANALYPAFNDMNAKNVVAFRVNYNDNETDDSEKELAREFGVAYQHTKVFVKNGERVLKSPESWNKDRYFSEIEKAL